MSTPERIAPLGVRWAVDGGDESPPGFARVKIIACRGGEPQDDEVLAWIELDAEKLREFAAGALKVADHLDGAPR